MVAFRSYDHSRNRLERAPAPGLALGAALQIHLLSIPLAGRAGHCHFQSTAVERASGPRKRRVVDRFPAGTSLLRHAMLSVEKRSLSEPRSSRASEDQQLHR